MTSAALLLATAAAFAGAPVRDSAAIDPATHSGSPLSPEGLASGQGAAPASGHARPWWDGAVYRLDTAPGRVSDIALQPGESLIAVAAGDTARWVIGDTTSGSGPTRRTHILVKPAEPGLRTNLVITTDRRVYHLDLASGAIAMTGIAWTYPQDELLALRRAQEALAAAEPVAAPIAVERLDFGYAITGDRPPWRPVRAFDDGAQVFIEFPPGLESMEAPPLFVVGASGDVELVNYRKRGRYYVVDRLFGAAELRLGAKRQQVVRIVRTGGPDRHKRRGRGS
jgi:type IV secretion system protein VirB9